MKINNIILAVTISTIIAGNNYYNSSNQGIVYKQSSSIASKQIAITPAYIPEFNSNVANYYHKQMDQSEYIGEFSPAIKNYFGDNDIRYNFCGEMVLLNTLDIITEQKTGNISGLSVKDLVNKYFVDKNGNIATIYQSKGYAFRTKSGDMSPTSIYRIAEKIGNDTNLWQMDLIYGTNDFTSTKPLQKTGLESIVNEIKKSVFDNDGILIMHVGIQANDKFSYFHYITVLDLKINNNGSVDMLIVDSMGTDYGGYYGWVNSEEYTTPLRPDNIKYSNDIYTGIYNIYGIIPTK